MSKHYAHGVFRRLAEQNHNQSRHFDLAEYDPHPTKEEVVEDMVENGYEEGVARSSVQMLWEEKFSENAS